MKSAFVKYDLTVKGILAEAG
jgi:hypothetical protein